MSFLTGDPLFNDFAVLVQNLDGRAFQFLAVRHVHLADLDAGPVILNQDDFIAIFVLGRRRTGFHRTVLVNGEGDVCRQLVSFRSHRLAQRIFLIDVQQRNLVRLILVGHPLLDDVAVLVQNLDRRAGQLFARAGVRLLDLDLCPVVLDQQDAFFADLRVAAGDLAVLADGEVRLSRQAVAFRCDRFLQGIFLARQEALHFVRFLAGSPLFNYLAVLVQNLDRCAFQFLAVSHVHLADLDTVRIVCELYAGTGLVGLCGHGTVAFVRQCYCDFLNMFVIDHGLVVALHLGDGVDERAVLYVALVIDDRVECDRAVRGVLLGLQQRSVFRLQLEGELVRLQFAAVQYLLCAQDHFAVRAVGVGEGCRLAVVLVDDALGVGRPGGVSVVRFLFHLVGDQGRQPGGGLLLAVLQGEACNTLLEGHLSVGSADFLVAQRHREGEFLVGIQSVYNGLLHRQIALVVRVGEGQFRRTLLYGRFQLAFAQVSQRHVNNLFNIVLHVLDSALFSDSIREVGAGVALQVVQCKLNLAEVQFNAVALHRLHRDAVAVLVNLVRHPGIRGLSRYNECPLIAFLEFASDDLLGALQRGRAVCVVGVHECSGALRSFCNCSRCIPVRLRLLVTVSNTCFLYSVCCSGRQVLNKDLLVCLQGYSDFAGSDVYSRVGSTCTGGLHSRIAAFQRYFARSDQHHFKGEYLQLIRCAFNSFADL